MKKNMQFPFSSHLIRPRELLRGLAVAAFALTTCLTATADYSSTILADSPLGYWRLNVGAPVLAGTPSTATNLGSLGSAADGTYGGPTDSVAAVPGALVGDSDAAAEFNGTGGQITVPNQIALNPHDGFTVEVWANMTNFLGVAQSPLSSRLDSANTGSRGYGFYVTPVTGGGRWDFQIGRGGANGQWRVVSATGRVPTNQWCHLVGSYDGSNLLFYANGALVASASGVLQSDRNLVNPLRFGAGRDDAGAPADQFMGFVDEPAFYGAVLSPKQVLAHYLAATATPPTAIAPTFGLQPASATVLAGDTLRLGAIVRGSLPMQYQWLTNGVPLLDQTNLTLTLADVTANEAGSYRLVASNAAGRVTNATAAVVTVNPAAAPSFTVDLPATAKVYADGTAMLQVMVAGSACTYQWTSNGVPIPGAVSDRLRLPQAQTGWSGAQYRVHVTNVLATASSAICTLHVLPVPAASYASRVLAANPVAYWRFGDVADAGMAQDYWGGNIGAYAYVSHPVSPGALVADDDGAATIYGAGSHVLMADGLPFAFSGTNSFTLAGFAKFHSLSGAQRLFSTRRNTDGNGGFGFYVNNANTLALTAFAVADTAVTISPPFVAEQWYHLAVVRSNTVSYFYVDGVFRGQSSAAATIYYSGRPLQLGGNPEPWLSGQEQPLNADVDEFAVWGSALSSADISGLYYSLFGSPIAPVITKDPVSTNVYSGQSFLLSGQVSGTPPLVYQWLSNSIPIAGATSASLLLSNPSVAVSAEYTLAVTNAAGSVTSAVAYVFVSDAAPFFTTYPEGTNVYSGYTVALTAKADGSRPLTYLWLSNNVPVPDATNATLVISNASQTAEYTILATNPIGYVMAPATVTVQFAGPTFVLQPASKAVFYGATTMLSGLADGSQPIAYQWYSNSVPIPEGTNTTLVLYHVTSSASYTVIASNALQSIPSNPALVSPLPASGYAAAVLADQPVSYWRLNEPAGPMSFDSMGGRDGLGTGGGTLLYGLAGVLPGDSDTCVEFANGKIDVPYTPQLNSAVFTVELWARVNVGGSWRSPLCSRDDGPASGYFFYAAPSASPNNWQFWTGTGTGWSVLNGPETVLGEWVHLAGVYDGSKQHFYVNGQLAGSATTAFARNSEHPLRFGAGTSEANPSLYFPGDVDEIAYFNAALSPARIKAHYQQGRYGGLQISRQGQNQITLTWQTGTLLHAESFLGPWDPVPGATPPSFTATSTEAAGRFYRVQYE